jgi:hypothetical protein
MSSKKPQSSSPQSSSRTPKEKAPNFEDEANTPPPVPFDDALRRILKAKPQHKKTKPTTKGGKPPE